jgi:ribonucleotide reductase beta subunit family protein with ferritin-like domain
MEARAFYAGQEDQETVHVEAYMAQIEAIAATEEEREKMLRGVETLPGVKAVVEWAEFWTRPEVSRAERFIAFAAVEGVMFSAFFCALQWLRERKVLRGITEFNAFIARDEGIHSLFACYLVKNYMREEHRPAQKRVAKIMQSAVAAVSGMIAEMLPEPLPGLKASAVKQYVKFQADFMLRKMGYAPIYGVKNPFKFMDMLSMQSFAKQNFFEGDPNQYQGMAPGAKKWVIDESPLRY